MAALNIVERRDGSVTFLVLSGHLVADEDDRVFQDRVAGIIRAGQTRNIVVDLRGITYIDSGGVGSLAATLLHVRRRGGEFKLLRPSARVCRVLQVTHLTSVFEIFDREDDAARSFATVSQVAGSHELLRAH
jgi:anti-anti-sigma factor